MYYVLMDKKLVMAGARIEESLWRRFGAAAKVNGLSLAEALTYAVRECLKNGFQKGKAKA